MEPEQTNKFQQKTEAVKVFFSEVVGEMKKSTWPEKQELIDSTIVVIISLALMSAFVGISDTVLAYFLKLLTGQG